MYAPAIIYNISDRLRSARVNIMKRRNSMNILLHENLQYKCDEHGPEITIIYLKHSYSNE